MENNGTNTSPLRDISIVTAEIKDICTEARRMMLIYAVEIGRRLVEAKEILPHGEWAGWLKNEVEFSQSTANKHMQLFKKFGNPQLSLFGAELKSETFTNLSYSQALKLLAVPDHEVEGFVKDNNIEDKTVREIDKLIKERDEALAKAQNVSEESEHIKQLYKDALQSAETNTALVNETKQKYDTLSTELADLQNKLTKSKDAEKKAKAKLKELKANPEIPQEQLDKLKAEAEQAAANGRKEEIAAAVSDVKKQLDEAERSLAETSRAAADAERRVQELEKKLMLADPVAAEFRTLFNQMQDISCKAKQSLSNITDEDLQKKFRAALRMFADQLSKV